MKFHSLTRSVTKSVTKSVTAMISVLISVIILFASIHTSDASSARRQDMQYYIHEFDDALAIAHRVTGSMVKYVPPSELQEKNHKVIIDRKTGEATQIIISEKLSDEEAKLAIMEALRPHILQSSRYAGPEDNERDLQLPFDQLIAKTKAQPFHGRVVGPATRLGGSYPLYAEDYIPMTIALTGNLPKIVPAESLKDEQTGLLYGEKGLPTQILLSDALSEEQLKEALVFEIANTISLLAGDDPQPGSHMRSGIPLKGLEKQFYEIYTNFTLGRVSKDSPLRKPEDDGWSSEQAPRVMMAFAIKYYLQEQMSLKYFWPDVAERIRHYVNRNPRLRDIIQFN